MAAIDRIYVDKFEDYLIFKEWCEKQPKLKDKYGTECSISDYLYKWESFEDEGAYPIFSAPYYIDAYLIRNCPFDFIQDELKLNYGYRPQEWIDEAYNAVMNRNWDNIDFYTWLTPDDFKIVDGVVTMPNEPISDYELIKEGKLYPTSSIRFKSSENHSSLMAKNRKNVDLPAPCPPTRHTMISNLHPGSYTLRIAASIKSRIISFV